MSKSFLAGCIVCIALLHGCSGRGGGRPSFDRDGAVASSQTINYASGFIIEECEDYARVILRDPWDTARIRRTYLIVDRNASLPENLPEGTVVRTPLRNAVVYTTTIASLIEETGCIENICGICETEYVTSKEARSRIGRGLIADIGPSTSPNVEKIVEIEAEAIIASPFENSGYGSAEKLGIPIIEAADYMEGTPLGRAEWIRFYSLLFGRKEVGDSLFSLTESRYKALKALAQNAVTRPTVMLERKYGGQWPVPAGQSYVATMHADAGADYIFKDEEGGGVTSLSFETVLDRAVDADFWLLKYNAPAPMTYDDIEAENPRYKAFGAFGRRSVYACNTAATTYYDDIALHPDAILADFIHIYHPDLLPDHKLKYYFPLK